jgi:hypothetical protein
MSYSPMHAFSFLSYTLISVLSYVRMKRLTKLRVPACRVEGKVAHTASCIQIAGDELRVLTLYSSSILASELVLFLFLV